MVRVRFTPRPEGDLGVPVAPQPFFHYGSSISFSGQGVVFPGRRSDDDDIYLLFYRSIQSGGEISFPTRALLKSSLVLD
ncbi:hypothetical protein B296_00027119 [Ensete ventricosum]|uniref:Uncharacterized protein n=1 Tax=Ensete ventricosum TaxID=4639 RepID=A0A426YEB6_ENSVE|nr:hypothetical protein B296_00027119 [Ensete ventricosum]